MSSVESEKTFEDYEVRQHGYTTTSAIIGSRPVRFEAERQDIFNKLSESQLRLFDLDKDDRHGIIIACPALNGIQLNALLHYAAPSKLYGLDKNDLVNDWHNIYNPENEELLRKHATKYVGSENWALFESVREPVRALIKGDTPGTITPAIRLEKNFDGDWQWNFDEHNMFVLGPAFVAAFSPEITNKWPLNLGQDMGTTQALPLTLMKRGDLLENRFIKNAITLIENLKLKSSYKRNTIIVDGLTGKVKQTIK